MPRDLHLARRLRGERQIAPHIGEHRMKILAPDCSLSRFPKQHSWYVVFLSGEKLEFHTVVRTEGFF